SCIRFLIEAAEAIAILSKFLGEQFQSNFATETSILCEINLTHPANAKLFNNPITRNGCQFHWGTRLFRSYLFQLRSTCAASADDFAPGTCARNDLDGILRHPQKFCQKSNELAVRRSFDRRRSQADLQRSIKFADNFTLGRARNNVDRKSQFAVLL